MKRPPILLALLAFALPAGAQVPCGPPGVTATLDPQLALPGEPIQVTLTNDSSEPITLFDSCVYQGVYPNDACEEPLVFAPNCFHILTPVGPGQSLTQPWDQNDDNGQPVPNGTYSIEIQHDSGSCCQTLTISSGVLPECWDGFDNDADGLADLADPGCCTPGDSSEADGRDIQVPVSLDFGAVQVDQTATLPLRIDNMGSAALAVRRVLSDNAFFVPRTETIGLVGVLAVGMFTARRRRHPRVARVLGLTLAAAVVALTLSESGEAGRRRPRLIAIPACGAAELDVDFTPGGPPGSHSGAITITSNDLGKPSVTVSVFGEGI